MLTATTARDHRERLRGHAEQRPSSVSQALRAICNAFGILMNAGSALGANGESSYRFRLPPAARRGSAPIPLQAMSIGNATTSHQMRAHLLCPARRTAGDVNAAYRRCGRPTTLAQRL